MTPPEAEADQIKEITKYAYDIKILFFLIIALEN